MNHSYEECEGPVPEAEIRVFKTIESLFGPLVPDIKNALSMAGYTNFVILANLTDNHLRKIEEAFTTQMERDLLPGYLDTILALSAEIKSYGISNLAVLAAGDTPIADNFSPKQEYANKSRKSLTPSRNNRTTPGIDSLKRAIAEQVKRMQLMDDCSAANIVIYQLGEDEGGSYAVQCPMCPAKIKIGIARARHSARWVASNFYSHLKSKHPMNVASVDFPEFPNDEFKTE